MVFFANPFFVQIAEQSADIVVDGGTAAQIIFYHFLIYLLSGGDTVHAFGAEGEFGILAPPGAFGCLFPSPSHVLKLTSGEGASRSNGIELHHGVGFGKGYVII